MLDHQFPEQESESDAAEAASRSGAREEMELAGLEPATSWVRYRPNHIT
jgi:hypothetical protein